MLVTLYMFKNTYTCYPIMVRLTMGINSEYSQISEPAPELHSKAAPSVGGNITAQLVLTQEEIPEEGWKKKLLVLTAKMWF